MIYRKIVYGKKIYGKKIYGKNDISRRTKASAGIFAYTGIMLTYSEKENPAVPS